MPGALRRRLARPALRRPPLRHDSAFPRGPPAGESGSRQASPAPRTAGRRRDRPLLLSSPHPTGSRSRSRPRRRTTHALLRRAAFLRGITGLRFCAVVYGSTCRASRREMRRWVSDGKYGNASSPGPSVWVHTVIGSALNRGEYGAGRPLSAAGWWRPSPASSAPAGLKGRSCLRAAG